MNNRRATGTLTTVGGTDSVNIYCSTGNIVKIFVKATTNSTTFDLTLTDDNSNVVLTRTDETGELNETMDEAGYMNYTLAIANASNNEDFEYVVMIQE